MEQHGRLQEILETDQPVTVVPMGGIDFVPFHQIPRIATMRLGGFSVVIITSMHGALLGHIPPLPSDSSTDPLGYHQL